MTLKETCELPLCRAKQRTVNQSQQEHSSTNTKHHIANAGHIKNTHRLPYTIQQTEDVL